MDGIENARHDLLDAAFSLEAAIEVLAGIENDTRSADALRELVQQLLAVKAELDDATERLSDIRLPVALTLGGTEP